MPVPKYKDYYDRWSKNIFGGAEMSIKRKERGLSGSERVRKEHIARQTDVRAKRKKRKNANIIDLSLTINKHRQKGR